MNTPIASTEARDGDKAEEVDGVRVVNTRDEESDIGGDGETVEGSGDRAVGSSKLSEDVERETPADEGVDGDITVDKGEEGTESDESTEEEIPEELETEEKEEEIIDEDEVEDDGAEKDEMDMHGSEFSDRPELVEGTKYIVLPHEETDTGDTSAATRANRRSVRMNRKLEKERTSGRRVQLVDSDSEGDERNEVPKS